MAKVEAWFAQDLKKPVPVRYLNGSFFNEDAAGSRIGVVVYSDGEAVNLAGSITGYCVRPDGTTVPVSGTRSSNRAYIDIPQSALAIPGPLTVTIKNTESSVITTLCAVVGIVIQSRTGVQVDPGQTITDWTNQISAQIQACQDAADNIGATIAVAYSDLTFPVEVGTYAINSGNLYCCKTRIAESESFTASHWRQTKVCDEIGDLTGAVAEIRDRTADYTYYKNNSTASSTKGGATYTWNGSRCTVAGTRTSGESLLIFYNQSGDFPAGIVPGGKYYVNFSGTHVRLQIFWYQGSTLKTPAIFSSYDSGEVEIPAEATGLYMRLNADYSVTVDEIVEPLILRTNLLERVATLEQTVSDVAGSVDDLGETVTGLAESVDALSDAVEEITEGKFVEFDEQTLTDEQQKQARTNIGAIATADVKAITGNEILAKTAGKYIALNGSTTDVTSPTSSATGFAYSLVRCAEGDKFTVNAVGGASPRAWGFVSESGSVLAKAEDSVTCKGLILTAPADAYWFVVNDKGGNDSFAGEHITLQLDTLKKIKADVLRLRSFALTTYETMTGYYNSSGSVVTSGSWKSYIVPVAPDTRNFCFNSNLSLAALNSSKGFIKLLSKMQITNVIEGGTSRVAYIADTAEANGIAYVALPRNGTNLAYLRATSDMNVLPLFPFNSDSSAEAFDLTVTGGSVLSPAANGIAGAFTDGKYMDMAMGELKSATGKAVSGFRVFRKGTVLDVSCTPLSLTLCGQTADGPMTATVAAGGRYTFAKDFWGTVTCELSGSWAWSGFAPQNLGVAEAAFFIRVITPEDDANNPWKGKTWYSYGTSISDIGLNDTAGNNGHSGKYPLYLDAVSGMIRHNGAIGSGGIRTSASHGGNVLTALLATPYDTDLVTLETLPNDGYTDPANLGDVTDTESTTICGAFRTACEYLMNNTRARFVLLFVACTSSGTSASNSTHMAYINAKNKLKQIAEFCGIPVIDAEKDSADWAHRKEGILIADHIHPNYLGGEVLGRYIWKKLLEIDICPVYPQPT